MMKNDTYNLHKNYIAEQSMTISNDLKERIRQYLEDEDLVKKISDQASKLSSNKHVQIQLANDKFGILDGDMLFIQLDNSDKANPKYKLWIANRDQMYGDLDLAIAADRLWNAAKGIGTKDESFIAVGAAVNKIAEEKGIDAKLIFDKIDSLLVDRHGESLTSLIEGEYSGRAEVVGLNMFRREIEKSVARGTFAQLDQILFDVGLTVATMGSGTLGIKALQAGGKGAKVAKNTYRAAKAGSKTKNVSKLGKLAKVKQLMLDRMKGAWGKLPDVAKASRFKKAYPVGSTVEYMSKANPGKTVIRRISGYSKNASGKTVIKYEGQNFPVIVENLAEYQDMTMSLASMSKLIPGAAGSVALIGAKKAKDVGDSIGSGETSQADGINIAEIMGYYDTLAADPTKYIEDAKKQDTGSLAQTLYELKDGGGLFGNTTDQEELAIAILLTSINYDTCKSVATQYAKLDGQSTVSQIINDELGGDLGMFTSMYWSAATGASNEYSSHISNAYNAIKKAKTT